MDIYFELFSLKKVLGWQKLKLVFETGLQTQSQNAFHSNNLIIITRLQSLKQNRVVRIANKSRYGLRKGYG